MSDRIGLRMAHGLQTSAIVGARHAVLDTTANIYAFPQPSPAKRRGRVEAARYLFCAAQRGEGRCLSPITLSAIKIISLS